MSRIAVVIAGGDPPPSNLFTMLPPPVLTIAADSGVRHARSVGLNVDILVGDLDSADEVSIQWAVDQGAVIERHPIDKDRTDLELALERAARESTDLDIDELVVAGLTGGRLDHWLANLLTVAGPLTASLDVTAYVGRSRVTVIRSERTLVGRPGELVSLIPVGGPAHGVTTSGLDYPLEDETLRSGSSRGVSNTFSTLDDGARARHGGSSVTADVRLRSGTLLAVQPDYQVSEGDGTSPETTVPRR